MSFLTSRAPTALRCSTATLAPARLASAVRPLSVSAGRAAMAEEDVHNENKHHETEKHKQDSLKKQTNGQGHWKKELASSSEAAIKADRGETDASAESIRQLQKEGEELGKQKR